jgi:cobalt-zinc-cadmium efflux system protein
MSAHDHANDRAATSFTRAFAIGIALNTAFVAIAAFYGWRVNSLALLAEAGHNPSDVAGLVLALGGRLAGKLKPDVKHTYGWKRASILAAVGNAVILLVGMGALAWEQSSGCALPWPRRASPSCWWRGLASS